MPVKKLTEEQIEWINAAKEIFSTSGLSAPVAQNIGEVLALTMDGDTMVDVALCAFIASFSRALKHEYVAKAAMALVQSCAEIEGVQLEGAKVLSMQAEKEKRSGTVQKVLRN